MKRISFIFFSALLVIAAGSCKKFLEKPPQGQMKEEEAFKDEAGVLNFLNGEYTLIGDGDFYGGRVQTMNDILGDQFDGSRFQGDFSEIFRRQNSIFGGTRDGVYKKGYRIIHVANTVMEHLSIITEANRAGAEAQALFFRAFAHFELVRLFAQPYGYTSDNSHYGIPLRTATTLESVQRSTVKEVYDQVIADLKKAEAALPETSADGKYFRLTKWAAKALLAKVYFQMNDFTNAYTYANDVIASNKFMFDASLDSRFSQGLTKEGILVLSNLAPPGYESAGELRGNYRSDVSVPVMNFTKAFYDQATSRPNDLRKAWYSNTLQSGYYVSTKYNKQYFDQPIIHLTEIMLIRAESGAEIAGTNAAARTVAIGDINKILTRAYGSTASNLPDASTPSLIISTTRTERELELVAEGNRTQEIKRIGARSGANIDRRGSPWNCNGFILQFPKAEQDSYTPFVMNPEGGCF